MKLTMFLAVLIAATFALCFSGCSNSSDPIQGTSNEEGLRGLVYFSPEAQNPRVCFAYKVSGLYRTDTSCKLPYSHSLSVGVPFQCPWPAGSEGFWWIIVYNDKNKDGLYTVGEFLGIDDMCIRKDLSRGKFELVTDDTFFCSIWDATKIIGNAVYINTNFLE